jgi:hypothetical protein
VADGHREVVANLSRIYRNEEGEIWCETGNYPTKDEYYLTFSLDVNDGKEDGSVLG